MKITAYRDQRQTRIRVELDADEGAAFLEDRAYMEALAKRKVRACYDDEIKTLVELNRYIDLFFEEKLVSTVRSSTAL